MNNFKGNESPLEGPSTNNFLAENVTGYNLSIEWKFDDKTVQTNLSFYILHGMSVDSMSFRTSIHKKCMFIVL